MIVLRAGDFKYIKQRPTSLKYAVDSHFLSVFIYVCSLTPEIIRVCLVQSIACKSCETHLPLITNHHKLHITFVFPAVLDVPY